MQSLVTNPQKAERGESLSRDVFLNTSRELFHNVKLECNFLGFNKGIKDSPINPKSMDLREVEKILYASMPSSTLGGYMHKEVYIPSNPYFQGQLRKFYSFLNIQYFNRHFKYTLLSSYCQWSGVNNIATHLYLAQYGRYINFIPLL